MKVFGKEILRSIIHSRGRFLAILIIVALGTGFYAGLRMTGPDMDLAADAYYDGTNLYDLRVISTWGMTDEDVAALREVEGVDEVMPARKIDAISLINNEQYTVRIQGLDSQAAIQSDGSDGVHAYSDALDYLNRPLLVSGNWPQSQGECVISADRVMNSPVHIGDTIELIEGTQDIDTMLRTSTYTIVGFVRSAEYPSPTSLGSTSLGSGFIQQFLYVPETDFFDDSYYTEVFVTAKGSKDLASQSEAYRALVSQVGDRITALSTQRIQSRYLETRQQAQEKIDEAWAELERQRIAGNEQLEQAREKLDNAAAVVAAKNDELEKAQKTYDENLTLFLVNEKQTLEGLAQAYDTLVQQQASLDAAFELLWQAYADLDPADPYYQQKKDALDANQVLLLEQRDVLDQAWLTYQANYEAAQAGLRDARSQLAAAAARIQEGRSALAQARDEIAIGLQSLENGRAQADESLAQAEATITQSAEDLDNLEAPKWYVLDRTKNAGAESFKSDASRVDQIAQVFPFIFFLVAALVALTTMTRMVEEERMLIGTHKALGYGWQHITAKYLIYAALASGLGSILGIVVLSQVLPVTIFRAYSIMYSVPQGQTPIDLPLALLAAGLGVGITLLATWFAVASTLRESPAALMLPRAPKPGKRILLERIGPLWSRISFSWKVTFRNIFRYKRRFVMTIIGIAGCTALLLTGLGLSNSINDIIGKQYGQLYHYNTIVNTKDTLSLQDEQAIDSILRDKELVSSYTRVHQVGMKASGQGDTAHKSYVLVPQDVEAFASFITLRERVGQAPLPIHDDSVIVTEKLAQQLGVSVGDTFVLSETDAMGEATGDRFEVRVGGITEQYVADFIYMSPRLYEDIQGSKPEYSAIMAVSSLDQNARQTISDSLLALDGVRTVSFNDEAITTYEKMMGSVNSIVIILVIAAAALAFVVLYNLTNINITERTREIATLKVLGFLPREVNAYIYRETILLTMIGALVGLVLGVVMENYVVVTAETNQVMFGREIHATSFILAFVVTVAFSLFVMFAMKRKLKKIDMVESLKSVE